MSSAHWYGMGLVFVAVWLIVAENWEQSECSYQEILEEIMIYLHYGTI
jgi:hypothetical protein